MSDGQIMRDKARAAFAATGLPFSVVTPERMRRLRTIINRHMKQSGAILGTYRCRQRGVVKQTPHGHYAELRCRANYFDDREAVTFNTDGFIGFAGWADSGNVKPIIDGFMEWLSEVSAAMGKETGK